MSTFMLIVSTPDGDKFKGQAESFSVRGCEGDLAILSGHIPFITSVKPCDCKIVLDDETERLAHTDGGLLTVTDKATTFLTSRFNWI